MVNLLSRSSPSEPFARLDPDELALFAARLRGLVCLHASQAGLRRLDSELAALDAALEELDDGASFASVLALLEDIERARRAAWTATSDPVEAVAPRPASEAVGGRLVCYRPGRSLATGEAAVASRGFFDERDRPPIGHWLWAIARRAGGASGVFEPAIVAWVPEASLEAARAGCRACPNASLVWLDALSEDLERQLAGLLHEPLRDDARTSTSG